MREVMTQTLRLLFIASMLALPLAGCTAQGGFHLDKVGGVPPKETDWSRVAGLERGSTIRVTLKSGQPVNRDFVVADESDLVSLNLTDPRLPRQVRRALRNLALDRPIDLLKVSHGESLIEGRVRLAPDGVFLDGRKIVALEQVVERTARGDIAEISWVHRATGRGLGWGALIGAGLGLAVTLEKCGTDWSQETSRCGNLTPAMVVLVPVWGTLIGGAVGAGSEISTVVYRAQ